jgi:uncharacterized protein (DUF4415 family)
MPSSKRTTRMTLAEARIAAARIPAPPEVSDAEIERRASTDPDASLATDEQLASATREYQTGIPRLRPKQLVSLRIDPDVIDAYRSTGPGWQRRMHEVLSAGVAALLPSVPSAAQVGVTMAQFQGLSDRVSDIEAVIVRPAKQSTGPNAQARRLAHSGTSKAAARSVSRGKPKPSR